MIRGIALLGGLIPRVQQDLRGHTFEITADPVHVVPARRVVVRPQAHPTVSKYLQDLRPRRGARPADRAEGVEPGIE